MKTTAVNLAGLLDQLSEEKINLVVDGAEVIAAGPGTGNSSSSSSSESGPAAVSSSEVPGRGLGL